MATDHAHHYRAALRWEGNTGSGTATYAGYSRQYRITIDGKPDLVGSADPSFRGDATLHNPEDLLVAALSSCHLLSYLALCARLRVNVLAYEDDASGTMQTNNAGGGAFTGVVLRPRVTIAHDSDAAQAHALHERAHALCFIANSCNFPVTNEPTIVVAAGP